ncbi:hypothetical protein DSO57_1037212 [Entomophthora muscae]|uniref:Uncharacterized protein n=1 Tax=Entomophthora muscae TaxID=34485 RepID=A0ACC2TKS3_9FUNG|nr:hypothetical protein DSO57_1037212 [Entomophthora muscae]
MSSAWWPNQRFSSGSSANSTVQESSSAAISRGSKGHTTFSIFSPHSQGIKLPSYLVDTSFGAWVNDRAKTHPLKFYLPTAWNTGDKNTLLEVSKQGLRVAYTGPGRNDTDVAAVRANHCMPPQSGLFYFEVKIISKGREGLIGIGFCTKTAGKNHSWGYHGDDGNSFCCSGTGTPYGPTFTTDDTIGCGVNFRTNTAFYTKNGINLGVAFRDIKGALFPCIGLRTPGEVIEANFGQKPFVFDINHYMKEEKARLWSVINTTPITISGSAEVNLDPHSKSEAGSANPDQSSSVINLIITSYLVHHGYSATAKSFVKNSMGLDLSQNNDMEIDSNPTSIPDSTIIGRIKEELGEDREDDIVNRQEIRDYVLSGEIENAIHLTQKFYPKVFQDNPEILFQLQCRRFIEIIRSAEEQETPGSCINADGSISSPEKRKREDMDGESCITNGQKSPKQASLAALQFGQELNSTYGNSDNPEIKKALLDTFALLAYQKASQSAVAYLLDPAGREPVANRLNSAILVSQGRPPIPSLELIFRQSCLVTKNLVDASIGDGSFINVHKDCLL